MDLCRSGPVRSIFFYAEVTTARLQLITALLDETKIRGRVGSVLPLTDERTAPYMLALAPHKPGKIVLKIGNETM